MTRRCLVLALLVLAAFVLASCKSGSSKSARGSGANSQTGEDQPAAGGEGEGEATAEGGGEAAAHPAPAKTSAKGAAYLAQLATHLEQKACRCTDRDCLSAAQATITYDAAMDDELAAADRTRNEWLKNRELGCQMRAESPDDVKQLLANVPKAQKERDEMLAAIAAPYTIETTKPKAKAELERYEALRKTACACTTTECTQKLLDQSSAVAEALVDMTEHDRDRYAKLMKAWAACNVATMVTDMAQYVRDP